MRTECNPVDAASRGLTAHQLVHESCWLTGPEFLWSSNVNSAQVCSKPPAIDPQDPELKMVSTLATQSVERFPHHFESSRLDTFSDWFRAKNAVALCLLPKNRLKERKSEQSSRVPDGKLAEAPSAHQQSLNVECGQPSPSRARGHPCCPARTLQ